MGEDGVDDRRGVEGEPVVLEDGDEAGGVAGQFVAGGELRVAVLLDDVDDLVSVDPVFRFDGEGEGAEAR